MVSAAIHGNKLACDVGGEVRCEELNCAYHVVRGAKSTKWYLGFLVSGANAAFFRCRDNPCGNLAPLTQATIPRPLDSAGTGSFSPTHAGSGIPRPRWRESPSTPWHRWRRPVQRGLLAVAGLHL
jgi:hypothetical protein